MKRISRRIFSLMFLLAIVSGCSVLRVDVDVYKGPLANSEHVQVQQLIGLLDATGPLLVQLRNNMLSECSSASRKGIKVSLKVFGKAAAPTYPENKVGGFLITGEATNKMADGVELDDINIYGHIPNKIIRDECKGVGVGREHRDLLKATNDAVHQYYKYISKPLKDKVDGPRTCTTAKCMVEKGGAAGDENVGFLSSLVMFSTKIETIERMNRNYGGGDAALERSYMIVQEIGNTIRHSADELIYSAAHKKKLEKDLKREKMAVKGAYATNLPTTEVLENLLKTLNSRMTAAGVVSGEADIAVSVSTNKVAKLTGKVAKAETKIDTETSKRDTLKSQLTAAQKKLDVYKRADDVINDKKLFKKIEETTPVPFLEKVVNVINAEAAKIERGERVKYSLAELTAVEWVIKGTSVASNGVDMPSIVASLLTGKDTTKDLIAGLIEIHGDRLGELARFVNTETPNLEDANKTLASATVELASVKVDQKTAERKKRTAEKDKEKAKRKFDSLTNAVAKVKAEKPGIVAAFNDAAITATPTTVIITVRERLLVKAKADAMSDETKKTKGEYNDAYNEVKDYDPNPPVDVERLDMAKDAKQVIEYIVASLKHDYIESVSRAGEDNNDTAKFLAQAIEKAEAYKSNFIYIRPPSAYLRDSAPISSIQGTAGIGWKNELDTQWQRASYILNPVDRHKGIIEDMDKRNWQNINSVRVAGGGNANYAVVKDDIGNWYVKAYSDDKTKIMQSARNLAMASMGNGLGLSNIAPPAAPANNAPVGDGETPPATDGNEDKPVKNRTAFEKLFDKYKAEYEERAKDDYNNAVTALTAKPVVNSIKGSFNAKEVLAKVNVDNATTLKAALDKEVDGASTAVLDEAKTTLKALGEKTPEEKARGVIDAMSAMKSFSHRLVSDIHAISLSYLEDNVGEAKSAKLKAEDELKAAQDSYNLEKAAHDALLKESPIDTDKADAKKKKVDEAQTKVNEKKENLRIEEKDLEDAKANLEKAKDGKKFAIGEVTRIVRREIKSLLDKRLDAVKDYEQGVEFIQGAIVQ